MLAIWQADLHIASFFSWQAIETITFKTAKHAHAIKFQAKFFQVLYDTVNPLREAPASIDLDPRRILEARLVLETRRLFCITIENAYLLAEIS
jgi:hypothetical protein